MGEARWSGGIDMSRPWSHGDGAANRRVAFPYGSDLGSIALWATTSSALATTRASAHAASQLQADNEIPRRLHYPG